MRTHRHRQMGNLDQAMAAYTRAVDMKADYALAHNNMALVHILRAEFDAAAECLEKALVLDPGLDCNIVFLDFF